MAYIAVSRMSFDVSQSHSRQISSFTAEFGLCEFAIYLFKQCLGKQRYVGAAFKERRQFESDDRQSIVQVLSKAIISNILQQISIRCRDDANITGSFLRLAQPLKDAMTRPLAWRWLKRSQKLCLHFGAAFAELASAIVRTTDTARLRN
jgi:hypothetical protein